MDEIRARIEQQQVTRDAQDGRLVRGAMTAGAVGAIGVLATAWTLATVLSLGAGYAAASVAVFLATMVLVVGTVRAHQPHRYLGTANAVTIMRLALAALLVALLGEATTPALALSGTMAGLITLGLDGLDGRLARRLGTTSRFGARFDMEVDAWLTLVLSLLVWHFDKAGVWVLASGLLRYVFLGAGLLMPWLRQPLPPRRRRQAVCVVQLLALLVALAPIVPRPVSSPIAALGLLVLVVSFAVDIWWLAREASAAKLIRVAR